MDCVAFRLSSDANQLGAEPAQGQQLWPEKREKTGWGRGSGEWQRELGIGRTSAGIRVEVEVEIGLLQLPVAQTFPAPFRIFLLDFYKDYVYICHGVCVCVCVGVFVCMKFGRFLNDLTALFYFYFAVLFATFLS